MKRLPDPDAVLLLSGDCGRLVLEKGGETYRAEECMSAVAAAYGGRDIECFATPTGAMFSITDPAGKVRTLIIRIKRRSMDMGALVRLNELRRGAQSGALGFEEARALADEVASAPRPGPAGLLGGAALVAAFFCLLFGGGWREALVSGLIGLALKAVTEAAARDRLVPDFFLNSLGGAFAAGLAAAAAALLPGLALDPIVIGVLMLLVPGVLIVNAIRDLMAGDLVAGVARGADAFVSAAAISLGTALALKLAVLIPAEPGWALVPAAPGSTRADGGAIGPSPALSVAWALLGTLGYAMLCRLKPRDVLLASLGGALAWAAYSLSRTFLGAGVFSYLYAALAAGLYAEILGAALKRPATVYAVSALITLVPGGGMYYTLAAALAGDSARAASLGFETLLIAGLIAAGIAVSSVLARLSGEIAGSRRQGGKEPDGA